MATPVTFDFGEWIQRFPEFASVDPGAASGYFALACVYLRNDEARPIADDSLQKTLLYLIVAHIAQLNRLVTKPLGGGVEAESQLVGRIASASEGSVSIQTEMPANMSEQSAWWVQTKYGFAFWQAIQSFRSGLYRARPVAQPLRGPWWG